MEKLNHTDAIEEIKMLLNEDETSAHTEAEDSAPKDKKKSKPKAKATKKSGAKPPKSDKKAKTKVSPEKKKAKAKSDPEGMVSLATLCKTLKISGATARRKLREADYNRDGRWSWKEGSQDLKKVTKLLTPAE